MRYAGALGVALLLGLSSCSSDDNGDAPAGTTGGDELPEGHARVVHSFGVYELAPLEEVQPCIQWTVRNEQPIYVNKLSMTNDGGYHHSNWFVIPEDLFPGEDGFFECKERGFGEIEAAVAGSVLFAQSTQSRIDVLELPEGVVVKIPPKHKIVAGGHLLNLSNAVYPTELRMALEIIHPREVQIVVAPFRLTYFDLQIPARRQSRFNASCDFNQQFEAYNGTPLDLKLYYVIPHYHYLGDFFDLSVFGGPRDGESLFRLEGFNASSNGAAFDPPIDLTGATGFNFTCGYDNWRDVPIGWGVGDQEMCVMLGLADASVLVDGTARNNEIVGEQDGALMNSSDCDVIGLPKNASQNLPTPEEIAADFYVPPTDPGDAELPPLPPCVDTPDDAEPRVAPTLSNIRDTLFVSSCAFSSCHQGAGATVGLDLAAPDLHGELLGHTVSGNTDLPLIKPGDPDGSWLYRRIAQCDPKDRDDDVVAHMPLNAPFLVDPTLVAMVRAWIEAGAPND